MNVKFKHALGDSVTGRIGGTQENPTKITGKIVNLMVDAAEAKFAKVSWVEGSAHRNRWVPEADLQPAAAAAPAAA